MAEFQEVVRQGLRMCNHYDVCDECPVKGIYSINGSCIFNECSMDGAIEYENLEIDIMKWAAANPEPQYPSWEEWQKENFPDARFPISLCHFIRSNICPKPEYSGEGSCVKCRRLPIPADIAKKLGIKPKVSE